MIDFEFLSDPDLLVARVRGKGAKVTAALLKKMDLLMEQLAAKIISDKLSGQVLKRHSGDLAAGVQAEPSQLTGQLVTGRVVSRTFYGKFQELGTSGPYDILPTNKKALAFMVGGKMAFARVVHHPGLPPRPYMSSTLAEFTPTIKAGLRQAALEGAHA